MPKTRPEAEEKSQPKPSDESKPADAKRLTVGLEGSDDSTSTEAQPAPTTDQNQVVQTLLEQQQLLANELLELKQELAASRSIQPMGRSSGLLGLIESIAGPIGEVIKRIPSGAEGSGDSTLLKIFMDRLLARDALIDQVIMKQFNISPPVQHVIVKG